MTPPLSDFHDAKFPLHTHATCDCCKQMRRCAGPEEGSMKLARCKECQVARYCSRECQVQGWKGGHKDECKDFQNKRNNAVLASGNPRAWAEFAQWREYHHDSITNAALSHYIMGGKGSEADYTLHILLLYQNDDSLPVERKFRMQGCRFVHKTLSYAPDANYDPQHLIPPANTMRALMMFRQYAARDLQERTGARRPPRMGSYLLTLKFGPPGILEPAGLQPFFRIFAFADEHLRAKVNEERLPAQILERIFLKGRKQRFCCGKIPGMPSCCCGGWTHDKRNLAKQDESDQETDGDQPSMQLVPGTF
ncbi:unnamed protein product [Peniophora sp. CBMAI 1063]|nr:unnamed protein product [Peniophora sp. CBMAI 1063]